MPSHEALISQVNKLFSFYDGDHSGYIEKREMEKVLFDLFLEMRVKRNATQADFDKVKLLVNKSFQGRITKDELYAVLKMIN